MTQNETMSPAAFGPAPNEFHDSRGSLWRLAASGSVYRACLDGTLTAVVFNKGDGWRGVSSIFEGPHFIRASCDTPEDAAELLLEAEEAGADSDLWSEGGVETDWTQSKPKDGRPGYWRKRRGIVLAVRQCKPHPSGRFAPSWIATINGGEPVMNPEGKPWHSSRAGSPTC